MKEKYLLLFKNLLDYKLIYSKSYKKDSISSNLMGGIAYIDLYKSNIILKTLLLLILEFYREPDSNIYFISNSRVNRDFIQLCLKRNKELATKIKISSSITEILRNTDDTTNSLIILLDYNINKNLMRQILKEHEKILLFLISSNMVSSFNESYSFVSSNIDSTRFTLFLFTAINLLTNESKHKI